MIDNKIADDMINIMLRQMGAESIKTTPAHINIAKFEIGDGFVIKYMYEVNDEGIYLQRVQPYPLTLGKIYNPNQVVDIISNDLKRFVSAYNSKNFSLFIKIAEGVAAFDRKLETLFMTCNVPSENIEEIDRQIQKLYDILEKAADESPLLK